MSTSATTTLRRKLLTNYLIIHSKHFSNSKHAISNTSSRNATIIHHHDKSTQPQPLIPNSTESQDSMSATLKHNPTLHPTQNHVSTQSTRHTKATLPMNAVARAKKKGSTSTKTVTSQITRHVHTRECAMMTKSTTVINMTYPKMTRQRQSNVLHHGT